MEKFFVLVTFLIAQIVFGQTKLIAHKSHSGSNITFHKAMTKHSKLHFSDFGLPTREVTPLKKVKYICDSIVICTYTDNEIKLEGKTYAYTGSNDIAFIEKNLKNSLNSLYPLKVIVEGYEVKDPTTYYKEKYGYINRYGQNKKLLKLDTIQRISDGSILLKTKQNTYPLKGFEIYGIKELREIKWVMAHLYNTKKTTFIGFTEPQKERFKTIITQKAISYSRDYYDSINELIKKGKPYKSINKVKNKIDTIEEKAKNKSNKKEFIPIFKVDNEPFDFELIYIFLIGLISIFIGITYKIFNKLKKV